jgi:hypothetical protein
MSLLPNADVFYYPLFVPPELGDSIFNDLSIRFETSSRGYLNRKTMVFIDPACDITLIPSIWGKNQDEVLPFTPELNQLKTLIEQQTDFKFNICLANYYDNGKRSIGFHADNEEKGSTSCIASVSLGASRTFLFRTTGEKEPCLSLTMNGYSLLIMGQGCQENYQHSVPIDKTCKSSRLNLTFRLFDSMRYK